MIGRGLLVFRQRRGSVMILKRCRGGEKARLDQTPKRLNLLVRVLSPGEVFGVNIQELFPKGG
ncbi:hypothetical protein AXF42_Ash021626 [Apostasia shenzhenica]|uniref:Uncharacterized protein n=1 Tax=Apostasia shenzhenica TaxID=1088818 RepID=A0A2H9ZVS1_9ASPA|nr:hypothetical protein AXF42_Ash021626 [Apostasia shenzhenica]